MRNIIILINWLLYLLPQAMNIIDMIPFVCSYMEWYWNPQFPLNHNDVPNFGMAVFQCDGEHLLYANAIQCKA